MTIKVQPTFNHGLHGEASGFHPLTGQALHPVARPENRNPHSAIKGDKFMEFEFTGRHIDITPAIEQLARKELKRLDQMLDSAPARAHVTLSSEKHRKRTEI